MSEPVIIRAAVEGIVDEAVVRRLIAYVGGRLGTVYGKEGKEHLRQNRFSKSRIGDIQLSFEAGVVEFSESGDAGVSFPGGNRVRGSG